MKILEIGGYPPPNTGWSVRIKLLKEGILNKGYDCKVLNLGRYRKIKSSEYIDVQNGIDFVLKLILYRLKGYGFHIHMNGQAIKGPILALIAQTISLVSLQRVALTFHGGIEQLYFPKRNAGKMFLIMYTNFLFSKLIICNNSTIKDSICNYGPLIHSFKVHPIPAFSVQYLNYTEAKLPISITEFIELKKHVILCYIVLRNGFFVDTLVSFLKNCPDDIGIILTGFSKPEDRDVQTCYTEIKNLENSGSLITVDNLNHDAFMTLLTKCDIYLRTPVSDGVSSSVLEALMQGVPVVASENGRRPKGLITYTADDPDDLMKKINFTIANHESIKSTLSLPEIEDTLEKEIMILNRYF